MILKIIIPIFFLLIIFGCATQAPRPKLQNKELDLFRNEAFSQYSLQQLKIINHKSFNQSVALCHQGQVSSGLKQLHKKMEKYKTNPIYWLHVGNCYYLDNNFDKAKFYYKISLDVSRKKDKRKALAFNNLGILYLKNNHIFEAKDYFIKSYQADKSLLTPRYNLGQIYLRYGLLNQALKLLVPLERNNRKSIDLLSTIGTIYALQMKSNKAISYFKKIPKNIRSREDIACYHALALYTNKKYDLALQTINERQTVGLSQLSKMASKLKDTINNKIDIIAERQKALHKKK